VKRVLAAAAFAAAMMASPALATTTLVASQTAHLTAFAPDQPCPQGACNNANALTANYSLNHDYNYGLLQFDLSSLTGPVTSATVEIYHIFNGGRGDFGLYQVTSAWDMNTLTLNTAPSFLPTLASAFTVGPTDYGDDFHVLDLTSLVNSWLSGAPNYGLALIRTDAPNAFVYFTATDSPGYAPRLVIEGGTAIGGAPEPGVWAMMSLGFGAAGTSLRWRRAVARPA
jgi:hypothetical protein